MKQLVQHAEYILNMTQELEHFQHILRSIDACFQEAQHIAHSLGVIVDEPNAAALEKAIRIASEEQYYLTRELNERAAKYLNEIKKYAVLIPDTLPIKLSLDDSNS